MRRRPPSVIELTPEDRVPLEQIIRDGRTEQRVARRARILLAMSRPETVVQQLADQAGLTRAAIWALCRRYEEIGIDVIFDAPRSGRPWEISPLGTGRD
jgi:biotin operon repressor